MQNLLRAVEGQVAAQAQGTVAEGSPEEPLAGGLD